MPKLIKAFMCEFCPPGKGRPYASSSSCKAHEGRCHYNPTSRACGTCKHSRRYEAPVEGEPGHVRQVHGCAIKAPVCPQTTLCASWQVKAEPK